MSSLFIRFVSFPAPEARAYPRLGLDPKTLVRPSRDLLPSIKYAFLIFRWRLHVRHPRVLQHGSGGRGLANEPVAIFCGHLSHRLTFYLVIAGIEGSQNRN